MKVLITGVAGFIGANLAERLIDRGYSVVGIDDLSQGIIGNVPRSVDFHQADILEANIERYFEGVDVVFHLAAKNDIGACEKDPDETRRVNVDGTHNVVQACFNVRKIVIASSSAVYEQHDILPSTEKMHPYARSAYARSKQTIEEKAWEWDRGLWPTPKITLLRYFNVYGKYQDIRRENPPVMSAFIQAMMQKKKPVIYGDGTQRRDFIHVDDINTFHELCIMQGAPPVVNLGSGSNHSMNGLLHLCGCRSRPEYREGRKKETHSTLADITLAKTVGNWSPKISIEEGIRRMVDWFHIMKIGDSANDS